MRVYLPRIGAGRFSDLSVDTFEGLAAADRFREHELTPDPAAADVILFTQCHMVDWRLRAVREHPIAGEYWEKVMVHDERDRPWRSFPGVYVSTPARAFDDKSQRAWSYAWTPEVPVATANPDLLFSFLGSSTATCRGPLFGLRHPDAVVEEVRDFMFWDPSSPGYAAHQARYREVLGRSRFVLCPRGRGTSSLRLYETLAAGRVPVIISDEWVAPPGPDWSAFSLRWPEGRTGSLVDFLEDSDREWPTMSAAATTAYQSFFATEASFHRVVELCRDLREAGCEPSRPLRLRIRSIRAALRERSTLSS